MTMRAEQGYSVMTADDLERLDLPNKSTELVRGRLVVREPPGTNHGKIAAKLTYLVGAFVYPNDAGVVFGQDTGFRIESNPDTVRAPDVAFLRQERASAIPTRRLRRPGTGSGGRDRVAGRSTGRISREGRSVARRGNRTRLGHRAATRGGAGLPGRWKPNDYPDGRRARRRSHPARFLLPAPGRAP